MSLVKQRRARINGRLLAALVVGSLAGALAVPPSAFGQVRRPANDTPDYYVLSGPSSVTAGTQFSFTVTAYNSLNAIDTSYAGTVSVTSTDPNGSGLPPNATLTNGVGTFNITLFTAGSQTITATETTNTLVTGLLPVTVGPNAATSFTVTVPTPVTEGSAFNFGVEAFDQWHNEATGYTGTIDFTSTDPAASLPSPSTLTNGAGTFPATLYTVGSQTIMATDSVSSSVHGTSASASVQAPTVTVGTTPWAVAYDQNNQDVYVANEGSGTVSVINGSSVVGQPITVGSAPEGIASDYKTGEVFVANQGSGNVSVISDSNNTVEPSTIAVGSGPDAVVYDSTDNDIFVGNYSSHSVSVINGTTHSVSTITGIGTSGPGGGGPTALAYDSIDDEVYAVAGSSLYVLSPTAIVGSPISIGAQPPLGVAYDSSNGNVYVSSQFGLEVLHGTTVVTSFGFPGNNNPSGVAFDQANGDIYVSSPGQTNNVFVVNGANSTIGSPAVGASPRAPAVDVANGYVYVPNSGAGTVSILLTPSVASLSPAAGPGQGGTSVTVNGNNLAGGKVYFGGSQAPTQSCTSGASCTAASPNGSGTVDVTVVTADGGSITNPADQFTYSTPNPPATQFVVTGTSSPTAGNQFTITVKAEDASGHLVSGYAGTVSVTSTDPNGSGLPPNATLTNGVGTFNITLFTAGSQTITATETTNTLVTGLLPVTVGPNAATSFTVTVPTPVTEGSAFNFGVEAFDQWHNEATGYTGTIDFTSTDPAASLPSPSTLTNGAGTFPATLYTVGSQTIMATDSVSSSVHGTSASASVQAPTVTVGTTPWAVAYDQNNQDVYVANEGSGTVSVINGSSVVGQPITVGSAPEGIASDYKTGEVFVANQGSGNVSVISDSNNTVEPSTIAVGSGPDAVVYDSTDNDIFVGNYSSHSVSVINGTTHSVSTITGIGTSGPGGGGPTALAYDSIDDEVYAVAGSSLYVLSPTAIVGSPISIGAQPPLGVAYDSSNGNVYVSSQFGLEVLHGTTVVTSFGFPGNNNPSGVAFDQANGDIYVSSPGQTNNVFVVNGANSTIGSPAVGASPRASAVDVANGYVYVPNSGAGTVSILLTPSVASLSPAAGPGQGGTSVTVNGNNLAGGKVYFGGSQAPTQSCTSGASCTAASPNGSGTVDVTVVTADGGSITNPADQFTYSTPNPPATQFVVTGTSSPTAGNQFTITVKAEDASGHLVSGYAGTVSVTSTDPNGSGLPPNATLTNGVGTFNITLFTAGSQTITATETTNTLVTGLLPVTVGPNAATSFTVTVPTPVTEGSAFNFGVEAFDQWHNEATGYTGTIDFTSTDPAASLPSPSTLTNGAGTFPATLYTVGSQTIMATDSVSSSVHGTSASASVQAPTVTVGTTPWAVAYDQNNQDVYVANEGSGTVSVINGSSVVGQPITVGSAPEGIASDYKTGEVFVANQGSGNVSVISDSNNTVEPSTIAVGSGPDAVVYDSTDNDIFVGNYSSHSVSVINGTTHSVSTITGIGTSGPGGGGPTALAYDSIDDEVYAVAGSSLYVLSPTAIVGSPISIGAQPPLGVAYDSSNGNVYVSSQFGLEVLHGTTVVTSFGFPGNNNPSGVAFDQANGDIYVSSPGQTNNVFVVNGANSTIGSPAVGASTARSAVDVANGYVYVPNSGAGTVSILLTPSVASLSPAAGPGQGGTSVTVNGNNLAGGKVYFGGSVSPSYACNSTSQCRATSQNGSGTIDVTIVTPDGGSTTVSADQFSYEATAAAPTGLTAVAGLNSASLSWTAPNPALDLGGPVSGYEVYVGTRSGAESATPVTSSPIPSTSTSYNVSGLTGGVTYYFEVAAVNPAGTGPPSNEATATPTPTVTVGASPNPAAFGASVSLGATVNGPSGDPTPTGSVSFLNGSSTISGCQNVVLSAAAAACSTSALPVGADTINVTYSGDGNYGTAAGSSAVTVNPVAPGAPTGVSATAGGASATVRFSQPSSNGGAAITSYNVTATDSTNSANGGEQASGAASPIVVAGLTPGDRYSFVVTAQNAAGSGPASAASNSVTPYSAPGAPRSLYAAPANGASVSLSWTAPSNNGGSPVTSYSVYRSTTLGSQGGSIGSGLGATTYTDTTASSGVTYYYEVVALNAGGGGAPSNQASVRAGAPSAPQSLVATAGSGSVSLGWSAPTINASSVTYTIYRSTRSGTQFSAVMSGVNGTSFTDTGLSNGTTYYYEVAAQDGAGTGPASAQATATPASVPSAVRSLSATPASGTNISLSWTPPASNGGSAVTSYTVFRSGTSGSQGTSIASGLTTTTYTDTTTSAGGIYYYEVVAVNAIGTGAPSNQPSVTAGAPSAPQGLSATAASGSVSLSWSAPAINDSSVTYNIYRSTVSGTRWTVKATGLNSPSFTDTGLSNGTTYYYEVVALNGNGTGPASPQAPAVAGAPSAPRAISLTPSTATSLSLTWKAPRSGGGWSVRYYTVYRSTNDKQWSKIAQRITSTGYTEKNLQKGTTYYYKVAAVNAAGFTGLPTVQVSGTIAVPSEDRTVATLQEAAYNRI